MSLSENTGKSLKSCLTKNCAKLSNDCLIFNYKFSYAKAIDIYSVLCFVTEQGYFIFSSSSPFGLLSKCYHVAPLMGLSPAGAWRALCPWSPLLGFPPWWVRVQFRLNRYRAKKKAFSKSSQKWNDDAGKKEIERDFSKMKKYCKVIRAICHTQVLTCFCLWWEKFAASWENNHGFWPGQRQTRPYSQTGG